MESLHYLLMKAHTMLQRTITSEASNIGLTSGQPKILDYLLKFEGSDQKAIAAYCEIEQATVGSILMRMETAGLIERRQKNGNRRSLFVFLTDKGRKSAMDMNVIFSASDQRAMLDFSEEEKEQIKLLLGKLCNALDTEKED